jgi:hypothetical protein
MVMSVSRAAIATALFIPAVVGLGVQLIHADSWSSRCLILALLLLGPEQAYMAGADLRQIKRVQSYSHDPRLQPFHRLVWMTILGQLCGFYLASMGRLTLGLALILGSLIGFNLLAPIRLAPGTPTPVIPWGPRHRLDVILLNGVAGSLGFLWGVKVYQFWAAAGILLLVTVYVVSKLTEYYRVWQQSSSASLPHATNTVE